MKKILLIIPIIFMLLFSGCKPSENMVEPPFFKITDPDTGGVVYLLGTIHVGFENTVYPDEIYAALDECSVLAVELDIQALEEDQLRIANAMRLLECRDGNASDFFGEDGDEIRSFFRKKRIYSPVLEGYIPALWSSMLSNQIASDCGMLAEYGTDREMLSYAKKHSIKIVELETVEEQYSINANESPELQTYSLLLSVRTDYEELKDQLAELYRAWSVNDKNAFERMISEEEIPEELTDDYEQFYYDMYEKRQEKMAAFISETLKNGGKAVVAVGAMHCYATPDILDFLDEKAVIEEINFRD